jgi:hypothetical protein
MIDLLFLHQRGSNNPLGLKKHRQNSFPPVHHNKDILRFVITIILLTTLTLKEPTFCKGQESWHFRMGPIGCPETSVRNYQYSLHNSPGQYSSHRLRGGSFKSRLNPKISTWLSFSVRFHDKIPIILVVRCNIYLLPYVYVLHTLRLNKLHGVSNSEID